MILQALPVVVVRLFKAALGSSWKLQLDACLGTFTTPTLVDSVANGIAEGWVGSIAERATTFAC